MVWIFDWKNCLRFEIASTVCTLRVLVCLIGIFIGNGEFQGMKSLGRDCALFSVRFLLLQSASVVGRNERMNFEKFFALKFFSQIYVRQIGHAALRTGSLRLKGVL